MLKIKYRMTRFHPIIFTGIVALLLFYPVFELSRIILTFIGNPSTFSYAISIDFPIVLLYFELCLIWLGYIGILFLVYRNNCFLWKMFSRGDVVE